MSTRLGARRASLAALALLGVVYLWFWVVVAHRIDDPPYAGFAHVFQTNCGDFEHFYLAARAMRDGQDLYASGVRGYIYPPLIAFLYMPLTWLTVQAAAALMLVVNLALALACAWLASTEMIRRFELEASADSVVVLMAASTLLSATRLRSELQMWQTDMLMMCAILLALRWLDSRPWRAGLILGLAINIKYLPLVYLAWLVLRRRFSAAAGCVVGVIGFALLPALYSGWAVHVERWATAAAGIAGLFGIGTAAVQSAKVDPITAGYSLSITSGLARMMGPAAAHRDVWLASAGIAVMAALGLLTVYRGQRRPLLDWPHARHQTDQPWLGMVALEWSALTALTLAFSPQTNPRHTSLLLIVFAPLAAMLCFPRQGVARWPAIVAVATLLLGFSLPPRTAEFAWQAAWWAQVGGAGWSMVAMLPFFLRAGFDYIAGQVDDRDASFASARRAGVDPLRSWPSS